MLKNISEQIIPVDQISPLSPRGPRNRSFSNPEVKLDNFNFNFQVTTLFYHSNLKINYNRNSDIIISLNNFKRYSWLKIFFLYPEPLNSDMT